jgi:hypothetical protein
MLQAIIAHGRTSSLAPVPVLSSVLKLAAKATGKPFSDGYPLGSAD